MDECRDLPEGLAMAILGGIQRLGEFDVKASSIEFPHYMKGRLGHIKEMFGIVTRSSWMRHHIRIGADFTRSIYITVEDGIELKFGEPIMFQHADTGLIGRRMKAINDEIDKLNREMEMWKREAHEVKLLYRKAKEGLS